MAFYIVVYDVNQARGARMLKLMRRYLSWTQNSVFEGELTESQYKQLRAEAQRIVAEDDSVLFYSLGNRKYLRREVVGEDKGTDSRFL